MEEEFDEVPDEEEVVIADVESVDREDRSLERSLSTKCLSWSPSGTYAK